MSTASMMLHCGAREVTREVINTIPTPPALGSRHQPIPHGEIIDSLTQCLGRNGYDIVRERLAVGGKHTVDGTKYEDTTLFGVMDLVEAFVGDAQAEFNRLLSMPVSQRDESEPETAISLGFRSNNTRKHAVTIIAGERVFICDNLMMSGGSIVLSKKHTRGLDLAGEMEGAIDRFEDSHMELRARVEDLRTENLSDTEARAKLFDLFNNKTLPLRMLRPVGETYFSPKDEWLDVTPRSAYGLHNAVTRVLRDEPLHRSMELSSAVGRAFNL